MARRVPSAIARNAGLPDLPGGVVPRCPNGAIREANRGWMKGRPCSRRTPRGMWDCMKVVVYQFYLSTSTRWSGSLDTVLQG